MKYLNTVNINTALHITIFKKICDDRNAFLSAGQDIDKKGGIIYPARIEKLICLSVRRYALRQFAAHTRLRYIMPFQTSQKPYAQVFARIRQTDNELIVYNFKGKEKMLCDLIVARYYYVI